MVVNFDISGKNSASLETACVLHVVENHKTNCQLRGNQIVLKIIQ